MTPKTIDHRNISRHSKIRIFVCLLCSFAFLTLQCGDIAAAGRIANLSTRGSVGTGYNVMIAGVIVQGTGTATLIFRGIGPSMSSYFPPGTVLPDPYLQLFNSNGSLIFANNNWQDDPSQAAAIQAAGLAPGNGSESAIRWSLGAGSYTAVLSGGTGIGLVEVYDVTSQPSSIGLGNISTRAFTGSGYSNTIAGMILQGNKSLLFRGLGPSVSVPVTTLPNPSLRLYNSSGTLIQYNENWKDTQQNQIIALGGGVLPGFAPVYDAESAIVTGSLGAGNYTVTISDNSGASGVSLIEAYHLGQQLFVDGGLHYTYVGQPNGSPGQITTSPTLTPQSAGTITVHYSGYASGSGCPGQPCPPHGSPQLYAQLLDQNGNVVIEGIALGFSQPNVTASQSTTFYNYNWSGAPFKVRMMARSNAFLSSPDFVYLTFYDVYGQ